MHNVVKEVLNSNTPNIVSKKYFLGSKAKLYDHWKPTGNPTNYDKTSERIQLDYGMIELKVSKSQKQIFIWTKNEQKYFCFLP